MDDFESTNNTPNEGELNGFDTVESSQDEKGYTVTPDGGFYTKTKQEIIQDEVVKPQENEKKEDFSAQQKTEQKPKEDFKPYGQYGTYPNPYDNNPKRAKKQKKNKKRYGAGVIITASVLAAVIGAVSSAVAVSFMNKGVSNDTETPSLPGNNVNINIEETDQSVVEAVYTKVAPSVVGIRTTTSVMSFFGGASEASGEGSGVIYSQDGYIITNYHVIADAVTNQSRSKIEVFIDAKLEQGYTASVVGYNISSDLAVIKIDKKGLSPIELSDSDKLKVGQYVITMGNPGGLEFMDSVTYGVVSGLNRVVSADSGVELIQTDAAINPGNSGGALVDCQGKLVGINSSKIVSEEFEGMGFAIPSNTVKEICDKIIEKENSPEPYIGISISERYTPSVLEYYNYPVGAVVLSVIDGSPADSAGIERGDIITEFGGKEITDYTVLEDLMREVTPGDKVEIKLYRSGRYYSTEISVGYNNAVD